MGLLRRALLAGSQSRWLRERAMRRPFVRRAVSRFMPGEDVSDALAATVSLRRAGMGAVLTRLGENVATEAEADAVAAHYLELLERVKDESGTVEISVKPTQLGLDLDEGRCAERLLALAARAQSTGNFVWIDMEQTAYTDATLRLVRQARARHPRVGVCLQSYLRRTYADAQELVKLPARIRICKGAYNEPPEVAFPDKKDVDANYVKVMQLLLSSGTYHGIATHDPKMIDATVDFATREGIGKEKFEFQMLYGVRRDLQRQLARDGFNVRIYVPYGKHWYPYFMRRLAERPANVWFVLKNLAKG